MSRSMMRFLDELEEKREKYEASMSIEDCATEWDEYVSEYAD